MNPTRGLLLAAGPGRRYGTDRPKQFEVLAGQPVMMHSLRTFQASPSLAGTGLVVPPGERDTVRRLLDEHGAGAPLFLEEGGETRRESVQRGLERLRERRVSAVVIHDAARPAATGDLLERVLDRLTQSEVAGVVPGLPVTDTIKVVDAKDEETVRRTPPRSRLRRVQTPQAFRFDVLLEAHAAWSSDRRATDDAMMVEELGRRVIVVEGEASNVKLTYPEDRRSLERTLEAAP